MRHPRKTLALATAAAAVAAGALLPSGRASAASAASAASGAAGATATYRVSIGAVNSFAYPDDTPASAYLDSDGSFHFQESYSLYAKTDPRAWEFYAGTDFDDATLDTGLSNAVNPADPQDKNNDTTVRCNTSPTGLESTYMNNGTGYYSQRNYCDLSGTWVDPDSGDWYGLVHNEFTPQPFGDGLHYDAIDYTVSHDHGKTWSILGHAITSPYSTTRNDTAAFPNQTYDYGDGDQRLFVDPASGYFYVFYGSRVVNKPGAAGTQTGGLAHVARAPISGKMAAGTWQKWYDGAWTQPGIGGLESNMEPVDAANPTGYTAPAHDYDPANTGTADQQMAAGELPAKSPLFIMNITYDAYLGLYIGEPETVGQTGKEPQQFYATDNLATQKWHLIGDSGSYVSGSWYRWFADGANKWSPTIVGKTFRSYCLDRVRDLRRGVRGRHDRQLGAGQAGGGTGSERRHQQRRRPGAGAERGQLEGDVAGRVLRLGAGGVDDRGDRRRLVHRGERRIRGRARGGLLEDRLARLGHDAVGDTDRRLGSDRGPGVVRGTEHLLAGLLPAGEPGQRTGAGDGVGLHAPGTDHISTDHTGALLDRHLRQRDRRRPAALGADADLLPGASGAGT